MTGKAQKLGKTADTLFYEFLEVLRFVVEALLHVVGLRQKPPNPIRTMMNENDQAALERFKETYDDEFPLWQILRNWHHGSTRDSKTWHRPGKSELDSRLRNMKPKKKSCTSGNRTTFCLTQHEKS